LPIAQAPQKSDRDISAENGVDAAELVVAIIVGVPTVIAAVITILAYLKSTHPHSAGKLVPVVQ
jgi:putative heme degradation protein